MNDRLRWEVFERQIIKHYPIMIWGQLFQDVQVGHYQGILEVKQSKMGFASSCRSPEKQWLMC